MEFSSQEMDRLNGNPLYQTIGILVDEAKEGKAHSHLRPNPAFCWPFDGQPHGGILSKYLRHFIPLKVRDLFVSPGGDHCY